MSEVHPACQQHLRVPRLALSGGGKSPPNLRSNLHHGPRLSVSPRPTGFIDDFSLINLFLIPAKRERFAATFICGLHGAFKLNLTNSCAAVALDAVGRFDQVQNILLPETMVSERGNGYARRKRNGTFRNGGITKGLTYRR